MRIVQIKGRSEQGTTKPFRCTSESGEDFYVKGRGAGFSSLCREWIGAQIALRLELPVPKPQIVTVPRELIESSYGDFDVQELGFGMLFGSTVIPNAGEFRWSNRNDVPLDIRLRVLIFDRWICNADRTLGPQIGNPNLLWTAVDKKLHVIDHNLAFDPITAPLKIGKHPFFSDYVSCHHEWRESVKSKFSAALQDLDDIWYAMPTEWTNAVEETEGLHLEGLRRLLRRYESEPEFWDIP